MEIDVEEVQNAVINSKLIRIKALEKAKAIIDEEIQIYRNGIEMEMNIAGYKSKDFGIATVSIVSGAKYTANISPDLFEEKYGSEYIEIKKGINTKLLKKEKPDLYAQHFIKEEKPETLRITMNKDTENYGCCEGAKE